MTKVIAIKHGEDIFPEAFIEVTLHNTEMMIIRCSGELELTSSKYKCFLEKNKLISLAYFGGLKFKNNNPFSVILEGFIIDTIKNGEKGNVCYLECPQYASVYESIMNLKIQDENSGRLLSTFVEEITRTDLLATNEKSIQKKAGKIDSRLIKINRFIRLNYNDKDISLQTLSQLVNCSTTYLSNSYSKVFNIPPIYHLNKLRVYNAQILLNQSNLTIYEIARRVGYVSTSQFCSIFKRYFYTTPTEYRNLF
ncbi:helix-turn-helix transcriptional regulator [Paenibacillus camerounensis]|uniref:helix-turn-helix transcriptional regulator n=1 Tax=Paenibacillus camerounensis TaxID=1243663 RepID=UPI0005A83B38|nr:AraC family transcriptional regulator [Paenibacillus camerounensis]